MAAPVSMDFIDISTGTLFRAVSLAGGIGPLSRKIQVSQGELLNYAGGQQVMPMEVFLRLVDFVLADEHFVQPGHAGAASDPLGRHD